MDSSTGWNLVVLGTFLLVGYSGYAVAPRIGLPRVTFLIVIGAACGPDLLGIIPGEVSNWFPLIAHVSLAMVGFLLGARFTGENLLKKGRTVLSVSAGEAVAAAILVFLGLVLCGAKLPVAVILAGIAPVSAPTAVFETMRQSGARGPLSDIVLGSVVLDDAWGILLFSFAVSIVQSYLGTGHPLQEIGLGLWRTLGGAALGLVVAFPMSWIARRVKGRDPALVLTGGFVLLCTGIATVIGVSYLLAAMFLGVMLTRTSDDPMRSFRALERVAEPFLAVFFLLAGFRFQFVTLGSIGLIGVAYMVFRATGKVLGAYLGAVAAGAAPLVRRRAGWCLFPQASIALGLALIAQEQFPSFADFFLTPVVATAVIFESIGPLISRHQVKQAGERHPADQKAS